MDTPVDFLGKVIKEGDTLVYPVRRGADMWLKKIRVLRVSPPRKEDGQIIMPIIGQNDNGRRITLTKPERSIVVEG